jgi:hypothetical protein
VDADVVGDEGVMAFDRQVVDRASAKLGLADDGAQVVIGVNEAVVGAESVDFDEGVELVEDPVVRGGIKMLAAPERVTDNALAFVLVNFEDFGFVQSAFVVKTQDKITGLQFVNAARTTWNRDKGVP